MQALKGLSATKAEATLRTSLRQAKEGMSYSSSRLVVACDYLGTRSEIGNTCWLGLYTTICFCCTANGSERRAGFSFSKTDA
jgi:hypothetical protein